MSNPWNNPPPTTLSDPPPPPPQQLTTAYPNPTIFGGIDGTNATFYWQIFFQTVRVFRNGLLQTNGLDYGGGNLAVTFFSDSVPVPGDIITIEGYGTL